MLEIDYQTHSQFRDAEVIKHLATFVIGDPVNDFSVNNYQTKRNQVRDEFSYLEPAKENREPPLLIETNAVLLKQDG